MNLKSLILALSLLLSGFVGPVAATSECLSSASFEIKPKGALADGLRGKLVLRPVDREGEELSFEARVGAPATVKLPCSSQWEATAIFPDAWAPRVKVEAGASGTTTANAISLWPLGRIAGSVKLVEKGERLPKKLVVTTLAPRPPAPKDVPRGALDCPVDDKGKWQCPPLPGTTFDLVLSAEGFIPQYRWGTKVLAGKTTDLGFVKLERGASVAGWVEVEGGPIDAGCRARLAPQTGPGSGLRTAEKVRSTGREVPVRKDGFFQFVGVAPGHYSLEVSQEGFAPATVQGVEVWPRSETFLREPVTLKRPLRLELAISPPLDWLGRPWKVYIYRASDTSAGWSGAVYDGAASEQGGVTVPGQAPGRFKVEVMDGLDNRLFSQTLTISGPEDARQTIDLEILTVHGTLKLGKEPLAATIWFGGRFGSSTVRMESDQEGKFHGILPRDGWWRVDVASSAPKLETRTKAEVEADRQGRATVEIDLPATRVFGKVLDGAGRPVPSASFEISTGDVDMYARTDDSGSFDVRGLSEGMAHAIATFSRSNEQWASDRISLFLRDGEEVGPLELRMRKKKRFSGLVRSDLGPVPGAGITVTALHPFRMASDAVRTELDGTFTAQVPDRTETAAVIVRPPGHALQAFVVSVGEAPQPLLVSREGGELEIVSPERPKNVGQEDFFLMIFQNGLLLPTQTLYEWALGHGRDLAQGQTYAVPALAPGEYRACLVARAAAAAWEVSEETAPQARCTSGQLTVGGTLRLDLSAD
ncbi:MAG TPA: carboxypeptidase-like regulatory domain-containing protein [Thermoanaerobaculia bacterium]|nr:carboxypeptidase-like regulatory domain-containing protein [Thermoanaerobaculia bacterium]